MNKKIGAVLIAGGGITGMEAALNLADSGFKVYLVEDLPAIGGRMVQLDKTFPTGDCAMCTIAPRLVECGRHHNIEIITSANIVNIKGSAGDFKITVKRNSCYVSEEKCNACGDCEKACPVNVRNDFDYTLSQRKAIYKFYPQAIPNIYSIDKKGVSPCRIACPAGVNAHGYIALINAGKYKESLDLIREAMPLAATCGRICTHPCESECSRKDQDQALAICALKRFVADREIKEAGSQPEGEKKKTKHGKRVCIVGSGPAGLTSAYRLAKAGYNVTILEALDKPGGMLRWAIPDFRLPRDVVERDIEFIKKTGVELKTNVLVGRDISFEDIRKEYEAVFIATGALASRRLEVPGEDLKGVYYGLDFLKNVKNGKNNDIGKKVAVIGGGNTAIDSAMTARFLGASEVTIIYRRSRKEMPASPEEIEYAEKEGVKIMYLGSPLKVMGIKKVTSLQCIKMELGEMDKSGRRRPVPIKGAEFSFDCDTIIVAVGQLADIKFLPPAFKDMKGHIRVSDETLATPFPGVFAGGDVVSGPDVFVNAVRAGNKAAVSIDRFLKGEDLRPVKLGPAGVKADPEINEDIIYTRRVEIEKEPLDIGKDAPRETEKTLTEERAREEAARCLNCGVCSECLECVKVCEPEAIDHDRGEEITELNVGAVILAPGAKTFDALRKGEYGYGKHKDVITSVEFERILSASGPTMGKIQRPSDGVVPKKIAFIQCVGSRDKQVDRNYCSAVCCMYTAKEAIVCKEHIQDVDITVFFIDMRAFGKGYESYWKRAKEEYGVKYIRCMISKVWKLSKSGKLRVKYFSDNDVRDEDFDLIVLAVGLEPSGEAIEIGKKLGVELSTYNFCKTDNFTPLATSHEGIFVAGAFQGPKDIPESVVQGLGAASMAGSILSSARNSLTVQKEYPVEKDVSGENVRIGVFICHCGRNIASVIDVEGLSKSIGKLPGVVYSQTNIFMCSPEGLGDIGKAIKEHKLNRIVVASCTPRTHQMLFQESLKDSELNPYLFEMANIRDQCSWVHSKKPDLATQKAEDLTRMAVAKAGCLEPIKVERLPVTKKGLVIGGGLSGLISAFSMAEAGFEVSVIEKEKELGGNLRKIYYSLDGSDVQKFLKELIRKVSSDERIKIYTGMEVKKFSGFVGNFKTTIKPIDKTSSQVTEIEHGITVVATGALEYHPKEYLYGEDPRVITQRELEERIARGSFSGGSSRPFNMVMIQCVGSRNDEHPYCSRLCCSEAIKNALRLKRLNQKLNIFILYRDIRTYGMNELYYHEAREAGITFIRFDEHTKPEVKKSTGNQLLVTVKDLALDLTVTIDVEYLILSAGVTPDPGPSDELSALLKVPLDKDKFFLEAHVKLRPVDFATEGIFLCGLSHSPKLIDENICQAKAASARAITILSRDYLEVGGVVSVIDKEKCIACLTCVRVCPYNVPIINADGVAEIESAKCQGCGICTGECPNKAIQLQQFKDCQILPAIESFVVQGHR